MKLSQDSIEIYFHTPNKTLIYVVHIPEKDGLQNTDDYMQHYIDTDFEMEISDQFSANFGGNVILNDYETFSEKLFHMVRAL